MTTAALLEVGMKGRAVAIVVAFLPHVNAGNTAWVLASTALVLFMTAGLAFFYGGMVRRKNVLGMLMQNFFCLGLVSVLWAVLKPLGRKGVRCLVEQLCENARSFARLLSEQGFQIHNDVVFGHVVNDFGM
jgi:hypothetical protein